MKTNNMEYSLKNRPYPKIGEQMGEPYSAEEIENYFQNHERELREMLATAQNQYPKSIKRFIPKNPIHAFFFGQVYVLNKILGLESCDVPNPKPLAQGR